MKRRQCMTSALEHDNLRAAKAIGGWSVIVVGVVVVAIIARVLIWIAAKW